MSISGNARIGPRGSSLLILTSLPGISEPHINHGTVLAEKKQIIYLRKNLTMKIQTLLLLFLLGTAYSGIAQTPIYGANKKHFNDFKDRPLQVLLTGDDTFDRALVNALDEHWTFSEVQLRGGDANLEDDFLNEEYYFLTTITVTVDGVMRSKYFSVVRGGKQPGGNLNPRRSIFMIPVNTIYERELPAMAWRIAPVIKLTNDAMTKIREDNQAISSAPVGIKYMNRTYTENRGKLENKTLLIDENYVQPDDFSGDRRSYDYRLKKKSLTAGEIAEIYPYRFEVVSQSEMGEAITEKRKDTAVLIPVSDSVFTTIVYDTETYEVLYYSAEPKKFTLTKKFFKKMAK